MKNVLITGGTGSFGRAFVDRIIDNSHIERVVIYSRGEHAQEEMERHFKNERLRFFIGDVRDRDRLEMAMRDIDTVIHAAALKIVPVAEYNPTECIATNVGGAENVVKAAIGAGVRRVVALSTDKAVNPINLYGASKLAAEKIFIAANALSAGRCSFCVVRYGNVSGSRGSVLPLFVRLAKEGRTLPITDPKMTRFWITMDEAIHLVMKAIATANPARTIFVPKIPSIKIMDLAQAIGRPIEIVGIRPGEKLHEVLITEDEARTTIDAEDHFRIYPSDMGPGNLPEGFRYTSDTNRDWLTISQLGALAV